MRGFIFVMLCEFRKKVATKCFDVHMLTAALDCNPLAIGCYSSCEVIFVLFLFPAGPTDCIVEGEVLKLGGPFNQSWSKKHLKLYPNRLEFYQKARDGSVPKGKAVEVRTGSGSTRALYTL